MFMAAKPATAVARSSRDISGSRAAVLRLGEAGVIPDALERIDHRRHLAIAAPSHGDPPRGQVHARGDDSVETLQRSLDRRDAGAAARLRHRQVRLENAVAEVAAREHDLARGNLSLRRRAAARPRFPARSSSSS